jgi:Berberine and berberine like
VYGGGKSAISAVPPDATAFGHRDAFLVYQLYDSSGSQPYPKTGIPFVEGMVSSLVPNPLRAYPNYIDPTLTLNDQWKQLYFGRHVERLQQVKRAVDPANVFEFAEGFR